MNRFERVQEMIGNESDVGRNHVCVHEYEEEKGDFMEVLAVIDDDCGGGCFSIQFGVTTNKIRHELNINQVDELRKLRDFLNYWLEEEKPEVSGAVVASEIDPIFNMEIWKLFYSDCKPKSGNHRRTHNCLEFGRINTLQQLVWCSENQLMALRDFGEVCLLLVKDILKSKGLWLGMTEEDIRNWKPQK